MKTFKKILIPIVILGLLAGAFFGAKAYRSTTASADILPVSALNMNWFDNEMSLDGMVYDSDTQQVYVSPTQIITEIYVTKGQDVKAGDPLIGFDMTSQEITLQLAELSVLRAQNDLEEAYAELRRLQNTTPMPEPTPTPEPEPEPDPTPIKPTKEKVNEAWNYLDGKDTDLDNYYLDPVVLYNEELEPEQPAEEPEQPAEPSEEPEQPAEEPEQPAEEPEQPAEEPEQPAEEPEQPTEEPDQPAEEQEQPAEEPEQPAEQPEQPAEEPEQPAEQPEQPAEEPEQPAEEPTTQPGQPTEQPTDEPTPEPAPKPVPKPLTTEPGTLYNPLRFLVAEDGRIYGSFLNELIEKKPNTYVVIEVRDGNTTSGPILASWTLYTSLLTEQDPDASWSVAMRPLEDDTPDLNDLNGITDDYIEYQSGYTAIELAAAIYNQQQLIKNLDLSYRRSRLNLEGLKDQMADGIVRAKRDGTVTVLGDINNMPQDGSAFLKVEAGKGIMVQGGISELLLDKVSVGQEVMAYNWETGETYFGEISSIDEYPLENNYYYYGGNPNSSTYGFLAYFDDAEDLDTYSWMQLSLPSNTIDDSIYLPAAYIRNEPAGKYVMKDDEGKLKKQYIRCGKSFYGEYTQILEGLTLEDYIAFPYGDGALEGTKTVVNEEMNYYW